MRAPVQGKRDLAMVLSLKTAIVKHSPNPEVDGEGVFMKIERVKFMGGLLAGKQQTDPGRTTCIGQSG